MNRQVYILDLIGSGDYSSVPSTNVKLLVNETQSDILNTGSFVTTSSFNSFTSSYNTGSFTGSFNGLLFGTSSWAENALTASYLNTLNQDLTFNGNLTLNGTASISYLNVLIESASVIYSSGSNQFGDATNDTQTLIGAVIVSGSQQITGSLNVTQGITGSLFGTSSWATNSLTSSFITGSNVFGPFGANSIISASFAVSSSRAVTSSFAISSSFATSASFATTASFAISSSFATTSSFAISASNSLSSSFATTASFASIAGNASSISASITNNVNNYVLTATGTGVINGEANLIFDGTTLNVIGSLQNGSSAKPLGIHSHTEGAKTVALLDFSHTEGGGTFTGQYGYDVVNIGDNGALILDSTYGNITSRFTGGFILYDDNAYDSTYGFRRLQYTSASYNGTHTFIFLSDQTITTTDKRATVGIPGDPIPSGSKTVIPFIKEFSHAEGLWTIADGEASHAEGSGSTSIGDYSHAEGMATQAIGSGSHTEGNTTLAVGNYSHAEGLQTQTINPYSHTEGKSTYTGQYGYEATYNGSPGEYRLLEKYGDVSAEFTNTYLIVDDTFEDNVVGLTEVEIEVVNYVFGSTFITLKEQLTTSKLYIGISGVFAPLIADKIIPVNKESSHAEGSGSFALGTGAHAEGYLTQAIGDYSHAEGGITTPGRVGGKALGEGSHAEGVLTIAFGIGSHAEGYFTTTSGSYSHAEGRSTQARGGYSHAEGFQAVASGDYSHAEGRSAQAIGNYSHAEGNSAQAIGDYSHAEGLNTVASGSYQHVQGQYNLSSSAQSAFIIGNGQDTSNRSNLVFAAGNTVQITGSLNVTGSAFTWNGATVTTHEGGVSPHIPYFKTADTLATSSLYQSGSSTVIINQDNATTANPEALYVWQPHPTSFNVISGKGDINNYLQLNIQNTNQGDAASSDVVATADNGDESTNYIDMGINGENYAGVLGGPNDGYLYSTGIHLHIGNATPNQYVGFFAGGDDVDANMKLVLDANDQHQMTGSLDISGSLNVRNNLTSSGLLTNGVNTILGNTVMSGSSTIQGTTTMTGSLLITGSTTQIGSNTLLGNTLLSGSIIISGALGQPNPTISVFGDLNQTGYTRYLPVTTNIDTSLSGSYIFVSGSTDDLYFSQNGKGYSNVTRLRWLEGNLYTGLLNGGLITTQSSTVYRISSGSGIIVNLNASLNDNPYPTIQYLNWGNLTGSINAFTSSYQQCFVGIDSTNNIFAQGTPFSNGQFDTIINIGGVFFQNQTSINAVKTQPSVAYGFEQQQNIFNRAFGALKLSGYTLAPSGSSTLSLVVGSGTAYAPGANYAIDPNEPSYAVDNGTNISKIFRYRQSGSTWVYDTNAGAGYTTIDPGNYSNSGVLTTVQPNDWSIQRVFWFPNSIVKAIVVYYGNQSYSTEADAIANIQFESFVEAPNTAANAIYLGAVVIRGNGVFTTPADFKILPGGLFRQVGGAGGGGSTVTQTLAGLSDVAISGQTNGQPLVYNSTAGKWVNQSTLVADLTGTATSATTASYISPTFISASAAASGFGSGGGSVDTGSLLTTASFNSYTSSNTSQFAGTASFATNAQNVLGSVTTAATASYSTNFTVANSLTLDGTLIDYSSVNSSIVGNNNLYQIATGSYTSAFTKYTVHNGTNARAGEFITVWNGTTIVSYDNSTTDIGNTSDVTFASSIVTSQIKIDAVTATSAWVIKSTTTFI